ncbi:MAG TPA: PQQ-dependent sugar dehydrogenase, partial [Gemmatimonadaceae bacterium]|nr:PQQ-dependent sugar dehydrogenase [Gemmatimonadaceae bacterium]
WKGNILVGGLASNALVRLVLTGGVVATEERYLHELHERIRDVRQGDDGYIYLITDSGNGLLLRIRPKT